MISGLVLKYLNGECFVICEFYKYTLLASTEFNLTLPHKLLGHNWQIVFGEKFVFKILVTRDLLGFL